MHGILLTAALVSIGPGELVPGEAAQGEITAGSSFVESEALLRRESFAPVVGETWTFTAPAEGSWAFDLYAPTFDAWLALRGTNADGSPFRIEKDDGAYGSDARIELELASGEAIQLIACSVDGGIGAYELLARPSSDVPRQAEGFRAAVDRQAAAVARVEALGTGNEEALAFARTSFAITLMDASPPDAGIAEFERALELRRALYGDDHPLVAWTHGVFAERLRQAGRYRQGETHARTAAVTFENTLGPDSPRTARALRELANLLRNMGRPLDARPIVERAFAITERAFGPDDEETLDAMNALALVVEDTGDRRGAAELYARLVTSGDPNAYVRSVHLNNYASLLRYAGRLDDARKMFLDSLAIRERILGEEHPNVATVLNNLGDVEHASRNFDAAIDYFERATDIRRRTVGLVHPFTLEVITNLAATLDVRGRSEEAQLLVEEVLVTLDENPDLFDARTATTYSRLARVLGRAGRRAHSARYLERALEIQEAGFGRKSAPVSDTICLLAKVYGDIGRGDEAIELMVEGMETARALGLSTATWADAELGDMFYRIGRYEEAERHLVRAVEVARAEAPGKLADRLSELGRLYGKQRRYDEALAVLDEAQQHVPDLDDFELAAPIVHAIHGQVLLDAGRFADGVAMLERANEALKQSFGAHHPWTLHSAFHLAGAAFLQGDVEDARDRARATLVAMMEAPGYVLPSLPEAQRLSLLARRRDVRDLYLNFATPGDAEESYAFAASWKGQITREMAVGRESARELNSELVEDLRRTQAQLSKLITDSLRNESLDGVIRDLMRQRSRLEQELAIEEEVPASVTSVDDVRNALPEGAVLVDFSIRKTIARRSDVGAGPGGLGWLGTNVDVWVMDLEGELHRLDLGSGKVLEDALETRLEELEENRGFGDAAPERSFELERLLLDPLAPFLGGASLVVISPDGFLGRLPFAILEPEPGRFLVEDYSIVYVPDAASIERVDAEARDYGSLLAVGGVDYRKRADVVTAPEVADERGSFQPYWGRLPATAYEAQVVMDLHEDVFEDGMRLMLRGAEPTEERLKDEVERYSVLHLATHGFFQPEGLPSMFRTEDGESGLDDLDRRLVGFYPGLLSGLVCAGANRAPDASRAEGFLTAEEVGWLDLSGAELVVLSACETGLGRAEAGEGMLGLQRAFRVAGARSVISSLWSVRDEATSDLMQAFYVNLFGRGMPLHEALRSAQLGLLRANRMDGGEPLPSTWGAFTLSGAWE